MLKNYFKIAFRNFRHNKIFSFINITGLAIGISASLVIYLIVSYDFSFDKFENGHDRIYRVVSDMKFPDNDFKNSGVPLPLIPAAEKQITGVELFAPFSSDKPDVRINRPEVNKPDLYKKQTSIIYTDNNYFKLLQYKWLAGSAKTALSNPYATVLTESRAKAYFPGDDVSKDIGKTITYNDTITTTVTGIVKDIDEITDFTFKEFISYTTLPQAQFTDENNWGGVSSVDQFFVKLNPNTTVAAVQKQIQQLFDKHQKDAYLKNIFSLQPLSDIHFNSDYDNFDQRLAHRPTLYGLLAVAAILLLLGCINFINLTTAQAVQRAKEIGIRKTMGSSKQQLIIQFLTETFLLTLIATIFSIILIPFIIKLFADFIPPAININMLMSADVIVFIIALVLLVSLLSGFYPALILSKYNPAIVLKNQSAVGSSSTRKIWIRKSLTVTQFVFAQAFIIAAIIVSLQIQYALHKDLGFKKDSIITVQTPFNVSYFTDSAAREKSSSNRQACLHQMQNITGIADACIGSGSPASSGANMQTMKFNNGKKDIETTVEVKHGDADYFKLYNLKLAAGRYLQKSDTLSEYVINEAYSKFLGFKTPQDAIGKIINGFPIVGVVRDFYSQSLRSQIKPLVFYSQLPFETTLHIALKPETSSNEWKATIAKINKTYKTFYPDEEFSYTFFDESIAKFYESEQHTSSLLKWAAGLAIFISCLGLLGLVIYTTNQRRKEIGVRKVLGASIAQIVTLISKDFMKLVLLAFVIAAPIAWFGMNKWLQSFAYRTNISWWIFFASGVFMIVIALLTLSIQTIKAAGANPVKSLRTE
ncbi:MAG: ABC transporter permease [Parafilimonas sp.]